MSNLTQEVLDAISDTAYDVDGSVHMDYSGRGMRGKTCPAIYCDSAKECAVSARSHGLKGERTDSIGRGAVVYWPQYETKREDEEEDSDA